MDGFDSILDCRKMYVWNEKRGTKILNMLSIYKRIKWEFKKKNYKR